MYFIRYTLAHKEDEGILLQLYLISVARQMATHQNKCILYYSVSFIEGGREGRRKREEGMEREREREGKVMV